VPRRHASRVLRRAPQRLSALRPPLEGVSEAKRQSPDAAMRARERDGLFEIVSCYYAMFVLILRSAHAKDVLQTRTCVRASRRMRTSHWCVPSCFETHRSAPWPSEGPARVSRCDAPQHEGGRCAAHFGETNPIVLNPVVPAKAGTPDHRPLFMGPGSSFARPGRQSWVTCSANLRLQEKGAGSALVFPACSLQGAAQPQRVAPSTVQADS
jgi:hypothetical protein